MDPSSADLPATLRASDAVGRLMEFWGFNRHLGRVWTLLYLSPGPLGAARIQEELSISAGAASGYLRELQRWGVVKKVWIPGERRDFFEAETDLWKMVSRVIREREEKLLLETRAALEDAASDLDKRTRKGKKREKELALFQKERVEQLSRMAALAQALVRSLVDDQQVDLSPLDRDLAG